MYDGATICGLSIAQNLESGSSKWQHNDLSWQCVADLPGIERDVLRAAIQRAGEAWQRVCGIRWFEGSGSQANILITTQSEGPGNILADCQMPFPGITPRHTLHLRIDIRDAWAYADNPPTDRVGLLQTLGHEIGHGLGIGHGVQGAWMYASYNPRIITPQSWDIMEARARYGNAIAATAQPVSPPQQVEPQQPGRRRRFDGRVLRRLAGLYPALDGVLGAAGIDPAKIADAVDLPESIGGILSGEGLEILSVRAGVGGLSIRVMGREIPLGKAIGLAMEEQLEHAKDKP